MELKPLNALFPLKVCPRSPMSYQDFFRFTKKLSKEQVVAIVRELQHAGTKIVSCVPFKSAKSEELITDEILKLYYRYLGHLEAYMHLDMAEKAQRALIAMMFLHREVFQAFWEQMREDPVPNLVGELLYVKTPASVNERVDYRTVFDTLWEPLMVEKVAID